MVGLFRIFVERLSGKGKAADLAGEGFGGRPLRHRFFPPRFALRVVKERIEKKVLRRLRFVCCTCLSGSTSADGRWRLSGRLLALSGDAGVVLPHWFHGDTLWRHSCVGTRL
jgi:hypothetical protein